MLMMGSALLDDINCVVYVFFLYPFDLDGIFFTQENLSPLIQVET